VSAPDLSELPELRWTDDGLIAAIAQDTDGRVLMLAWMNEDTLRETLDTGRMVYWSRSRQERWAKGDTSGDIQLVKEAYYDCDGDVLLFVVDQQGKGACHTGEYSCFFRPLPLHAEAK
jgi:phosphoribosyl-AMP cyclohydrolase